MTAERLKGHSYILLANIIFGLNTPISKYLLSGRISPEALTFARMLGACACFWVLSLFLPRQKTSKKDLALLVFCSLFGVVLNQGAFIFGLSSTSTLDASVIVSATPIFVMVLAFFVLGEPITVKKAAGVAVGASGAVWLVAGAGGGGSSDGGASLIGDAIVLSSGLLYSIYFVMAKPITQRYFSATMMKWMFLYATLITAPFLAGDLFSSDTFSGFGASDWLCVGYVVFGATFLSYLLIPMALRVMRPTTVSMYNYIQPVVSSAVAIAFFGDELTFQKLLSAAMIFLGVYLVTISRRAADSNSGNK